MRRRLGGAAMAAPIKHNKRSGLAARLNCVITQLLSPIWVKMAFKGARYDHCSTTVLRSRTQTKMLIFF